MATVQADAKERPTPWRDHGPRPYPGALLRYRGIACQLADAASRLTAIDPLETIPSASRCQIIDEIRAAGVRINAISSRGQRSATVRANLLFMDAGIGGNVKE